MVAHHAHQALGGLAGDLFADETKNYLLTAQMTELMRKIGYTAIVRQNACPQQMAEVFYEMRGYTSLFKTKHNGLSRSRASQWDEFVIRTDGVWRKYSGNVAQQNKNDSVPIFPNRSLLRKSHFQPRETAGLTIGHGKQYNQESANIRIYPRCAPKGRHQEDL